MLLASSALLGTLPAGADDLTLGIFGNANMDDTIDVNDIEYVEGIIEGTNEKTELADANYDGKIDKNDKNQIEQIINSEEPASLANVSQRFYHPMKEGRDRHN